MSRIPVTQPVAIPPVATSKPGHSISGIASWYRWHPGEAAAGPVLRAFLGSHWRGMTVRICSQGHCVTAKLTDWMKADRLIDLDSRSFAALARLSKGILRVTIARV